MLASVVFGPLSVAFLAALALHWIGGAAVERFHDAWAAFWGWVRR